MASSWKPSLFGGRPARPAPAAQDPSGTSAAGAGETSPPGSAPAATPKPAVRRGPLPSLADLGAFDGVSPGTAPRRSGRLTDEDLRALPGGTGSQVRPSVPAGKPADPLARPKPGRSWHSDTPFETVQTPSGVLLRKDAEARALAQARAAEQARAAARQAEVMRRAEALDRQEKAAPAAGPMATEPRTASGSEFPQPPAEVPAGAVAGAGEGSPARKTVPAVNVAWGDLNAAVQAGWIRPEAAHALWARWLARKPLTHTEDDGEPQSPLPPLPSMVQDPAKSVPPDVAPVPQPEAPAADEGREPQASAQGSASSPAAAMSQSAAHPAEASTPRPENSSPPGSSGPEPSGQQHADAPPYPQTTKAAPDAAPHEAGAADDPHGAASAAPEVMDVEILEPLQDANARRAAELAFQPPPVIQVTDVIESRQPPVPAPADKAPGWIVGQCLIALLSAAVTAVSVGLGHVLFGPMGAALAAAAWSVVVWRMTSRFHASGQVLRAVLGAHLMLPLLALTVWQLQEAAGWWPAARPMDLFSDAPLETMGRAVPAMRLDWRWLALAGVPLVAAVVWLIRLRRPVMLGAVTALLWMVTFQAVAGVLQSLGLAFHGMTIFMLLLGALTLLGAFYMDLKSRPAGVADFAQWPYWFGAALLGAGWLSLSVVAGPMTVLRYAAWLLFIAVALSLARPSLVAMALALAGFEVAFLLADAMGSQVAAGAAWLLWLALTGAVLAWMLPRASGWAPRWQFWMPQAWRKALKGKTG